MVTLCRRASLFQSTPSPRRETVFSSVFSIKFSFQSTPSPRRETASRYKGRRCRYDFNPLPPQGGRQISPLLSSLSALFQSTPSPRRETLPVPDSPPQRCTFQSTPSPRRETHISPRWICHIKFQSTPSPRRETNVGEKCQSPGLFQSTPSPRRETPPVIDILTALPVISIHSLPKEGDDSLLDVIDTAVNFNPLPPQGGRRVNLLDDINNDEISIHSLPKEGDNKLSLSHSGLSYFNPLPPQGGRPQDGIRRGHGVYFNPLPPQGGRRKS